MAFELINSLEMLALGYNNEERQESDHNKLIAVSEPV